MKTYTFRLKSGQDLRREIEGFVKKKGIRAGVVLSAVGGLRTIHLRLAGARDFLSRQGEFEIVSITGTLSVHGVHLHLSASDETGQTVGGHLSQGNIVRLTTEVVIGVVPGTYRREPDDETGYEELVVEEVE